MNQSVSSVVQNEPECTRRCRSKVHGSIIMAAITRGSEDQVLSYLEWICCNYSHVIDSAGRTALHVAAACGKRKVVEWLVRYKDAVINARDVESGYTPLHRSVFYGQLHVARNLIKMGANVTSLDHDDLTAIEHAMKDQLPIVEYSLSPPCEVYVWGTNMNYNLGLGNQQNRQLPEVCEQFRKENISIKQVAMHKFHSIFVSHDGRAFSCGHGQGGRLGVNVEQAILAPRQMKIPGDGLCAKVSVGRDHTVLLFENGQVATCGMNTYHQLGHNPPPQFLLSPRSLPQKLIKGEVVGINAARFHTVIWSHDAVYTFGLNAGQLGQDQGEKTQKIPKQVSALNEKDCYITHVAASDGATVVATRKGDIYILHEYQRRKIASKQLDIGQISVVGGHLDSRVDTGVLMEKGGEELKVIVLTKGGKVMLWQESLQQLTRCIFSINRLLVVTDMCFNRNQLLFVTKEGEAFHGEFQGKKKRSVPDSPQDKGANGQKFSSSFNEFLDKDQCEFVRIKKIPHVHRAVAISSDPKGRNFAVIQSHPKIALWEIPQIQRSQMREQLLDLLQEAHENDSIHDVVFEVGFRHFAAHQCIIASKSEPLMKLIGEAASMCDDVPVVKLNQFQPDIFEQILQFIYTDSCGLLKPGPCPVKLMKPIDNNNVNCSPVEETLFDISKENLQSISAYEVYSDNKKKRKSKGNKTNETGKKPAYSNPLQLARAAARKLGMHTLSKLLEGVTYEDGYIKAKDEGTPQVARISFDRKEHMDLYDVSIKCEDGSVLRAHKCILAARLEYFHSMLGQGWIESAASSTLSLPVPNDVLEIIINYLYQDASPIIEQSEDLEFVCNVLVVADQLFIERLKEICEVTLSNLLSLKNVCEIMQFSATYNANQLKSCCMQFICLNLSAVLESRNLDVVSDEVMEELTKYYCELNPVMSRRVITPYSDGPTFEQLESVCDKHPVAYDEGNEDMNDSLRKEDGSGRKNKVRKRRTRKSTGGEIKSPRTRNESISSNASLGSDDMENGSVHALSFEDLTERTSNGQINGSFEATSPASKELISLNRILSSPEDNRAGSNKADLPWVKVMMKKQIQQQQQPPPKVIVPSNKAISVTDPGVFTEIIPSRPQVPVVNNARMNIASSFPSLEQANKTLGSRKSTIQYPEDQKLPELQDVNLKQAVKQSEKKITKLSQKQRKKLAAEQDQQENTNAVVQSKSAWGNISQSPILSVGDIMKKEAWDARRSSPVPREISRQPSSGSMTGPMSQSPIEIPSNPWMGVGSLSPTSPTQMNFSDIVADEKKQRDNLRKVKAKPLEYTQMEDRAMEALLQFYNAANATEERITVQRILQGMIATPVWITSHH